MQQENDTGGKQCLIPPVTWDLEGNTLKVTPSRSPWADETSDVTALVARGLSGVASAQLGRELRGQQHDCQAAGSLGACGAALAAVGSPFYVPLLKPRPSSPGT